MDSRSMIKVGRGHDCQVRITDISVSRLHAFFRKSTRGDFLLEDNGSKFGTLIQVRKPYFILKDEPNFFQLGRTILEINVKVPIRLCRTLSNCLCPCLVENNGKHKVAKGILTLDAEGDMYPDDFMPKLYP